eukprot:TRINITY_DN13596_c0_g1_i1.p1 TRINITY_DN13596_c0_g1~~TRINITY_DN13596_c0_g1_i1.p1  ORF type:complete len:871 (+),score=307.43 TRINITY_DN13596_c0_g1_i1:139-2751(+)
MASPRAGKRVEDMPHDEFLAEWRKGYTSRQRNQETLGSDPIVGLFPFLERLSRRIKLPVPVPDTVVYEHSFPKGWYWFEPPRSGEGIQDLSRLSALLDGSLACGDDDHRCLTGDVLRSVTSKGCETASIRESFSKKALVASSHLKSRIIAQVVRRKPDSDTVCVEYLDHEGLDQFFKNCPDQCILSKFVPPKGTKNDVVVAIWARDRLVIRRFRNNNDIYDASKSVEEIGSVEDATLSTQIFSPAVVTRLISKTMRVLIREIESYEKKHVVEFQAHFKVGVGSRLYLLWITKLAMIRLPHPQGRFGLTELSNYHVDAKKKRVVAAAAGARAHDGADRNALRQRGALLSNFIQKSIGDRNAGRTKRDIGWPSFHREEESMYEYLQRSMVDPKLVGMYPGIGRYLIDPPEEVGVVQVRADFSLCLKSARCQRAAAPGFPSPWMQRYVGDGSELDAEVPHPASPCPSATSACSDESVDEPFASWADLGDTLPQRVSWAPGGDADGGTTASPASHPVSPQPRSPPSPAKSPEQGTLQLALREKPMQYKNPFTPGTSGPISPVMSPHEFALVPTADGRSRKSSVFYRRNMGLHSPRVPSARGMSPAMFARSASARGSESAWADVLPMTKATARLRRMTQRSKITKREGREAERLGLVKALKPETRARYQKARARTDRILGELEDLEYELYSRVLAEKAQKAFYFSMPDGCPAVTHPMRFADLEIAPAARELDVPGHPQDAFLDTPQNSPRGNTGGHAYCLIVDGTERLYKVKRAMLALRTKIFANLTRYERVVLLKDFSPKVLSQLRYHRRPGALRAQRRSVMNRRVSSVVSSNAFSDVGDDLQSELSLSDSSGELLHELEGRKGDASSDGDASV